MIALNEKKTYSEAALSVICPVYNNEGTLAELTRRLLAAGQPRFRSVEIIYVNDCSRDGSRGHLKSLCERHETVRAINFARNFGQHTALMAGMRAARGDYLLFIDADLEESPEDLPALMAKLAEGHEIAAGVRQSERKSFARRQLTGAFMWLYNQLTDYPIVRNMTSMRLMTRKYVDFMLRFPERPFLAGISSWIGLPIGLVPVAHVERPDRKSGYSLGRLLGHARMGLVGFSVRPIRFSFYVGMAVTLGSLGYSLLIVFRHFMFGNVLVGYSSVIGLLSFLMGVQYIFLGLLGEYIGEIFIAGKNRPAYLVYDQFNLPEPQERRE